MFSSRGGQRVLHKCLKILRLSYADFANLPDLKKMNVVKTVEKTVDNNTSIFIESPIHVKLQPIDVNDINAHNKLCMQLYSVGKETSDFQVKQSSKRLELFNKNTLADKNDVCLIQVPYQLKVHVTTTENASVHCEKLEGEEFVFKTQKGGVNIGNLKAQDIVVESVEGEIVSEGRLQASNIELKTGLQSGIQCNNIMSNNFIVTTHAGQIVVKSCYSDKAHFTTAMGNMKLERIHTSALIDIIQHGKLHMTNFQGDLKATLKSGEVYLHASKLTSRTSIFIHEKGKVDLLFPVLKDLPAINLIADKITIDDKLKDLGRFMDDAHPKRFRVSYPNETEPLNELHVVCNNGSIDLKETDMPFMV